MNYDEVDGLNGVPTSDDYRTSSECGGDCVPDTSAGSDELDARIALICPERGIQSLVDPFEDQR